MSLSAIINVELTSSDPESLLNLANKHGIALSTIEYIDLLHVRVSVSARAFPELQRIVQSRGDTLRLLKRTGIQYVFKRILQRPVLLFGIVLWVLLLMYLPTRILFVEVVGNNKVSTQQISSNAEMCGVYLGASRREVRSERIKNSLLGMLPQIQWVGINTYGCRAVISVVERTEPELGSSNNQLRSVVASHDGIVTSITVTKGNGLCKVGQAVRKGQLLVSPYTDCGLTVKAEMTAAEVYGQTNRKFTATTPRKINRRMNVNAKKTSYSLRLGNKIINLSKDSGILHTTCAKMYEEKVLCLPGGFALPIAVIRQTTVYSQQEEVLLSEEFVSDWVRPALLQYLNKQMISGKVLQSTYISELSKHCYSLLGNYVCEELIGKYHNEEMLPSYG